ncbi:MAG: tetratricopeptide repeat protein [Ignavibacteria bacterium]|nr:tetratricopeptide repeat protein [Ignavibacteria bacterium]
MEFKLKQEKIKPFNYLLSRFKEKDRDLRLPKFCFLLGAGCSVSSGIPGGGGIIDLCKKISFATREGADIAHCWTTNKYNEFNELYDKYALENKEDFKKYEVEIEKEFEKNINETDVIDRIPKNIKDDFKGRLSESELNKKLYEEFKNLVLKDSLYGKWFANFNVSTKDRQELIESIVEDKKPMGVYIFLAELIKKNFIHNIFTTNFDDLLNEALLTFYREKARVYAHNEIAKYISTTSRKVNIIKLHGDYLFENIKGINEETSRLEDDIKYKMKEMLNHFSLIVVGYGGADDSIMSTLEEIKSKNNNMCLIWCNNNPDKLNWRVINLLNHYDNSYFVEIEDFDTFVFELWYDISGRIGGGYIDLKKNYEEDERILKEYRDKYFQEIEKKEDLSQEVRSKVSDMSKIYDILDKADKEENPDTKIDLYTKIININDKYKSAYFNRGLVYLNDKEDYDKAIKDYNKTIELKPDDTKAYYNRGTAYLNKNDYDNAMKDYDKAIELKPDDTKAYYNRGFAYSKKKDYDKAIEDYDKIIELKPNDADTYNNRGIAYFYKEDYDKALEDYHKAIELNPNFISAYNDIIEALIIIGKCDEALEYLNKVYTLKYEDKDEAILKYLDCIINKIKGNNTEKLDKELDEILKKDFELTWSFDEIENWLKDAKLLKDVKEYIKDKTELLKKKKKK